MITDHWFQQVDKILEATEITSDATKIRLETFQLKGEAHLWWTWAKASKDIEAMTWVLWALHGQVFLICSSANKSPRISRTKTRDNDGDAIRGEVH